MSSHQQLAQTSHRYRLILTVLLWCTPLMYALVWFTFDHFPEAWAFKQSLTIEDGLTPVMRGLGFCVSMIKGTVMMYGIWTLICLFKLYEATIFFKAENVACFKKLSLTLIWWVAAGVIVTPLTSLILTMNNAPGARALQISLQSADITALVVGGVLRVIAGVMEDGQRLQDEMELTI